MFYGAPPIEMLDKAYKICGGTSNSTMIAWNEYGYGSEYCNNDGDKRKRPELVIPDNFRELTLSSRYICTSSPMCVIGTTGALCSFNYGDGGEIGGQWLADSPYFRALVCLL